MKVKYSGYSYWLLVLFYVKNSDLSMITVFIVTLSKVDEFDEFVYVVVND